MKIKKIKRQNKIKENKIRKLSANKIVKGKFQPMRVNQGQRSNQKQHPSKKKQKNKNLIGQRKNFMYQMNKKKRKAQCHNLKNQCVKTKQLRLLLNTQNKNHHLLLQSFLHQVCLNLQKYTIQNHSNLIIQSQKVEGNIENNKRKI